jgi:hypothetical protein
MDNLHLRKYVSVISLQGAQMFIKIHSFIFSEAKLKLVKISKNNFMKIVTFLFENNKYFAGAISFKQCFNVISELALPAALGKLM